MTLPLAAPGLGAAASLVFIAVVTELTATLLLAPIGTQTLATQVWADTSTLAFAAAAPYAAVMAVMSMAASWLLARRFGRRNRVQAGAVMADLNVNHLSKAFDGVPLLHNVNFVVKSGSLIAILGASGSGKTTLLRLIAGFERPDAGVIQYRRRGCGLRPNIPPGRSSAALATWAQEGALFPHLSVADNITFGLSRAERRHKHTGGGTAGNGGPAGGLCRPAPPQELSGGEQQRVALARALAPRTKIVATG